MSQKTILDVYNEYKNQINYFKKKEEKLKKFPEKNKRKLEELNKDRLAFMSKYYDFFFPENRENKND